MRILIAISMGVVVVVSTLFGSFAGYERYEPTEADASRHRDGQASTVQPTAAATHFQPPDVFIPPASLAPQHTSSAPLIPIAMQPAVPGLGPTGSHKRAYRHPHGKKICASGCVLSNHPTSKLSKTEFHNLMAEFANDPLAEDSRALETLLYYGRQTREFLKSQGTRPLDRRHAQFLSRELSRTHALVSCRIVDEQGTIRASLPPTRVPLDVRHVFRLDVNNLQPLEASGTVKRVGLHHLWTRI